MKVGSEAGSTEVAQSVSGQYLSFTLGGEHYGVDILRVQEIKGWEEVRALPDTPEYVKGVLDLRGAIVPIIDLRARFKLEKIEYTPTTVIIVLSIEQGEGSNIVGVVVDGVSDVLDISDSLTRSAPDLGAHINTRFITGMVSEGERMVVLLDVDKLFSPDDLGVLGASG
ncbi:chemotaxis protein CheW [Candidatus Endoriftia persephone]